MTMITPRVATGIAVRDDDDRILLIRRGPDAVNGAGQWSLPGGKLDAMETLAEGAGRELTEEVGIVADVRPTGIVTEDMHWGPELHFVTHYHQATAWTGEARIMEPHKHDGLAWIRHERLEAATRQGDPTLPLFEPTRSFVLAGGLEALV